MIICYFGDYDPGYGRNRVLLKGLRENGVNILECRSEKKGFTLYQDLREKHKKIKGKYDILIVGQSFNTRLVWLAKLLSRKKIVWDAFYSFYDKYAFDNKVISPNGLRGWYLWLSEWLACRLANMILLDADAHIDYFARLFRINKNKFIRAFIGADDSVFIRDKFIK
jgi:hypothetical protein